MTLTFLLILFQMFICMYLLYFATAPFEIKAMYVTASLLCPDKKPISTLGWVSLTHLESLMDLWGFEPEFYSSI